MALNSALGLEKTSLAFCLLELESSGPSFTIDNSWTGGIEILKQAMYDISTGRVDHAIVGVSNLLLNSNLNSLFHGLNKLSSDGKTRSFDQMGKYVKLMNDEMGIFVILRILQFYWFNQHQ